jgi:hypothetical protein
MKKIFVILFLIVGATLFGGGQNENPLKGTWVKEDGTTLTFYDKEWEFLSIEGGAAGYGTSYRYMDNNKNNGRLGLTITCMINLKNYNVQNDPKMKSWDLPKQFQKDAIIMYGEMYPDRILDKDIARNGMTDSYSYGSNGAKFILEGNTLIISDVMSAPPPTGKFFYSDALSGTYTRVDE